MKWIDIPPVWLLGFALALWFSVAVWSSAPLPQVGAALVVAGIALILGAIVSMARARTTPVPHRQPTALVTTGLFALSRNPIYLGDALILMGLALRWGAAAGMILVPAFIVLITQRFITAEEARLATAFPDEFADYRAKTRRWL